jgi:P-type E1-E2 ATPase
LAVDNEVRALIKLTDSPRTEAIHVVEQLQKMDIQTWMVTGDQKITSVHLAEIIGIPDCTVIAGVLPHQKVDTVRLLQSIGKNVAFVGDGVNDGPALAIANVGIAIGAGTEVALESADIVLVKNDLTDILNAIDLSRATCRMIKWNFTWGFMYNIVMMPIACGVLYPITRISIPPALAGLSELFSSVPVILYSLLLMYWKPPFVQMNKLSNLENKNVSFTVVDIPNEDTPMLAGKLDYGTLSKS